jgi:predicted metal-dependent hydrolase
LYVTYNDEKIPYEVKTNKKLKNLYITITPSGVIVKNPNYPPSKVQELVQNKAKWIYQKLLHVEKRKSISRIYKEEGKVLLFGEKQLLHIEKNLADFYKEKSIEIIPDIVEKWAKKMDLNPAAIKFRKAKRRWGSCNHKNELSFNTSLVQLPMRCIEYIIVHELSHIPHKHHKASFWLHVERFMPDYRDCEKTIKEYSPEIA